jgi:hypothetical protein
MKLMKVLCSNFLEVINATFRKIPMDALEDELPLPAEAEMNLSSSDHESKNQDNLLELAYEYQVNVFLKWTFFIITFSLFGYSFYLATEHNIICVLTCIPAFVLHRLYISSKILAGMKKSLIEFSFL